MISDPHSVTNDPVFVGREVELNAVIEAVKSHGHVLIVGMAGLGKTALAKVAAASLSGMYPDGMVFVDMRGTAVNPVSPADALAFVINRVYPSAKLPDDLAALAAIYRSVLVDKRAVILLDDAGSTSQTNWLLPPRGCALIATSRSRFTLGTAPIITLAGLKPTDATVLLRSFRPGLSEADGSTLATLCAGLPLALRLAGAHLGVDGDPTAYIQALGGGRLAALDAEAPDAGEITISEALHLSENQLTPEHQQQWLALGVFTGDFDQRAAQALWGQANSSAALEAMQTLVDASLVEYDEKSARFRLHDLVRDYTLTKQDPATLEALRLAHAQHYTLIGQEADRLFLLQGDAVGGLALFDRERTQIESAWTWLDSSLSQHKEAQTASTASTSESLLTTGAAEAARQLLALVDAVVNTSSLRFDLRKQRIPWLESQLRAARITQNRRAEGFALGNLGNAHRRLGNARHAIDLHNMALSIFQETREMRMIGVAMSGLGAAHEDLGDLQKAIEYYGRRLTIARELRDRRGELSALSNVGGVYDKLRLFDKAREVYEQALQIARDLRDLAGFSHALGGIGRALLDSSDPSEAFKYFEEELDLLRKIDDRSGQGNALMNIGIAHAKLSDSQKAIVYYEQALPLFRVNGDRRGEGNALWNSALSFKKLGNRAEALSRAGVALAIREAIEDPNVPMMRKFIAEWEAEG